MSDGQEQLHVFDRYAVWAGFKQLLPLAMFVAVFGAAFGLAAAQTGLSDGLSLTMSALVFAGAAQFATLELWGAQVPLLTLIITVFAINARHLLMGATLYPWLQHLPWAQRYGVMIVASDANWALAMQAFNQQKPGFGLLFGGGLALWLMWLIGTYIGLVFGGFISDPKAYGLDMVMGCFLLAMVVGGEKNLRVLLIWLVAAVASLLAYRYLPENSHVVVGAIAGGLAGSFFLGARHEH